MSIQPLIFKNGVYTLPRSSADVSALLASINLGNVNNTSDLNKPVSTATQTALDLKANLISPNLSGTPTVPTATPGTNTTQAANTAFVSTAISNLVSSSPAALDTLNELASALGNDANFSTTVTNSLAGKVDLTTNQTINGIKIFSGSLQLPNSAGTTAGMIWRSGDALNYKDGANITKVLLNSAGNLSNLMDKQVSLNNLVGVQTANRVLRSDGTNTTLSLVNLATDTTNTLPIASGGTGSNTQNFVDLSTDQTILGIKNFRSDQINSVWSRIICSNSTANKATFFGSFGGVAGIYAHNFALSAWSDLYINGIPSGGGGNVYIPTPTASTSTTTGGLILGGGLGAVGAAFFGGVVQGTSFQVSGTKVVGARETGWTAGTGTPNKGAYAADTATVLQTSQRLLALEQTLRNHGLIN